MNNDSHSSAKRPAPLESFDAFVSHSSKDKEQADLIVQTLESRGIKCWIAPRDIVPGKEYGEAIISAIAGCKVMVLVFSRHANESQQVAREVERAVHHHLPVVPFRIENVEPTKSLEYFISSPHWLDAYAKPFEGHLDYLFQTVNLLLERTASIPKAALVQKRVAAGGSGHSTAKVIGLLGVALALAVVIVVFIYSQRQKIVTAPAVPVTNIAIAPRVTSVEPPATTAVSEPAPSPAQSGSVVLDDVFYGSWLYEAPALGYSVHQTIASDGTYSSRTSIQESGEIIRSGSKVSLRPTFGTERPVNWKSIDENTVAASVIPASVAQMINVSAALIDPVSAAKNSALIANPIWKREKPNGVYEFKPEIPGQNWEMTLQTGPTGLYVFRAELRDQGEYRAHNGKWSAKSQNKIAQSGDYTVIDANSISFSTPYGQFIWKREK